MLPIYREIAGKVESVEFIKYVKTPAEAKAYIREQAGKSIYTYYSPDLSKFTGKEEGRLIKEKLVGKHSFKLWLVPIPDEDYEYVAGYDYVIEGPNWLSGNLKAQGYNEEEIFTYFDNCNMSDVSNAYEEASNREYLARCSAAGEY